MGWFKHLFKAKATATARHILLADEQACLDLKQELEAGADFADMAKKYSTCPSGKTGGSLGSFKSGRMVKPFNEVVFSAALHTVHGPVKTQFGYHLIEITERNQAE